MKRLVVTILTVLAAAAPAWAGGYGAAVSRAAVPGCASCGQPAAQAYFAPAPAIQRTVDYAPVDTVSTQTEYVPVERQVVTRSYVPVVRDVAVAPSYDVCPPAAAPVYAPGCVPGRALAPGYGVGVM
jgi:hypothetical protein